MSAPWGSGVWNRGFWGEGNQNVTITFGAWGQSSWGNGTWGVGNAGFELSSNLNSISIKIDNATALTGQQLNSTVNTITLTGDSNLNLSTNLLQISLGEEVSSAGSIVTLTTLNSLNTTLGAYSITADGNTSEIVVGDSMTCYNRYYYCRCWIFFYGIR
jgi:hypothetical protein